MHHGVGVVDHVVQWAPVAIEGRRVQPTQQQDTAAPGSSCCGKHDEILQLLSANEVLVGI